MLLNQLTGWEENQQISKQFNKQEHTENQPNSEHKISERKKRISFECAQEQNQRTCFVLALMLCVASK